MKVDIGQNASSDGPTLRLLRRGQDALVFAAGGAILASGLSAFFPIDPFVYGGGGAVVGLLAWAFLLQSHHR